jgi:hypothetical protein
MNMPTRLASNLVKSGARFKIGSVAAGGTRLARNEAFYREVNERVAEVAEQFEAAETSLGFTCECGASDCAEPIEMTLAVYEAIRAEPTRFFVVRGHERPEIESVVERHSAYLVVEKREEDAAEVARETDPR